MGRLHLLIGIPARTGPELLQCTLDRLRVLDSGAAVLLLPDLPDDEMSEYLESASGYRRAAAASGQAPGNAGCFNRLIHAERAEVYLLLEGGALPAHGALERMLATFRRIPACGLTGPSTNRSWNEQGVVPEAGAQRDDGEGIATSVQRRFGTACRSLKPVYSLADFCYMVRREVVEAIGDADEGYGAGPCWEMDYNIRAARAGFLGVWTCGAYVHRTAAAFAGSSQMVAQLDASRQRYQSKFCGLHLRGLKSDFRTHCRGDACPNFAPAGLIALQINTQDKQRPEDKRRPEERDGPEDREGQEDKDRPMLRSPEAPAVTSGRGPSTAEAPWVTCIMPTYNRRRFVPGAVACFQRQDYAHCELIVVDDGTDAVADLVPADERIRYLRVAGRQSVGVKRNFACEHARGEYIVHWDDDDWHAPDRIRRQVKALQGSRYQVAGTTTLYYRHHEREEAFVYSYGGAGNAWMGALIYPRAVWQRIRFEAIDVGEDVRFLARIPVAQRLDLGDRSLTVCTVHAANVSPKVTTGPYWKQEPIGTIERILQAPDDGRTGHDAAPADGGTRRRALISCIMPTHHRRAFVLLALEAFQSQTYEPRELIVIDDGPDPVEDLMRGVAMIRYQRVSQRLSIGAKRNLACSLARGEIIAHWDDDDWYGPDRLAYQAAPINEGRYDLTGLINRHTLEMPAARFWTVSAELHRRLFVGDMHGGTLMYAKSLLQEGVRYPEASLAEDAALIRQLSQRKKRMLRMEDAAQFVYMRHGRNTWRFDPGRFIDPAGWRPAARPDGFSLELLERYRDACSLTRSSAS